MEEKIKFNCPNCKHSFLATSQEYKTKSISDSVVIKEGYCPICGTVVKIDVNNSFWSSNGGKF